MNNRMKAGKAAVLLGTFGLMCTMTGCAKMSEKAEEREEDVIRIEASADDSAAQNGDQREDVKKDAEQEAGTETMAQIPDESGLTPTEPENTPDENHEDVSDGAQEETELEGDVRSVEEDSMVVSRIDTFTEDGKDFAISYVGEGPDVVLITVFFSENTEYIVRTVKNGGVNGDSDVEDRTGALSDIQKGSTVRMNGSYEGGDFHAERVIIYNFI